MTELINATGGKPYDIEDVCCDYIRYVNEHVPKGYDHLTEDQRQNKSTLKRLFDWGWDYPPEIVSKMRSILG